ncbi:MAG: hypothetical protein LKJ69_10055 [Lactobacillus sp.]|jgi:hypothetical protein|nr:hypothetical protein [Lactobacillus sp.]MCI2033704.1 hypothetical protein [Lactobacillus sp.]
MQPTHEVFEHLRQQLSTLINSSLTDVMPYEETMSGSVHAAARVYTASINGVQVLLLFPFNESRIRPAHLVLWRERLAENSDRQFVAVLDKPVHDFQAALIKGKVPFITMSESLYLPFLALRISPDEQAVAMPKTIKRTHFTHTSSRFLTVLIYASAFAARPNHKDSVFDATGYTFTGGQSLLDRFGKVAGISTVRTMNRALVELEAAGIVTSTGERRDRLYTLAATGLDLFYEAYDQMSSPVVEIIQGDHQMIEAAISLKHLGTIDPGKLKGATASGLTALSEISELEPDSDQDVFAFASALFKQIFDDNARKTLRNITIERYLHPHVIRIERWADDPIRISRWLAGQGQWEHPEFPDPISLYLANTEKDDGRVTGILEDLIEQSMED